MKGAYYNEVDPFAVAWLRELIEAGHLPAGDVDERDIREVKAGEIKSYVQHHFFAGIGGWSLALNLARWPESRPVWTGSCPCQPFSCAGKRQGADDERHLWPVWFDLIRECRPDVVFGEQVAAAIRLGWLDGVCADLEGADYAFGSAVLGAHSALAPHIRQRVWWVANAASSGWTQQWVKSRRRRRAGKEHATELAGSCGVADTGRAECEGRTISKSRPIFFLHTSKRGRVDRLGNASARGFGIDWRASWCSGHADEPGASGGPWARFELIPCADGKARRIEPGTFPLAYGVPARVGRLRGYGNAIVPQVAAEFVRAYVETWHGEGGA